MSEKLSKSERLCSTKAISSLMAGGRYVSADVIRCRYMVNETSDNRILVAVPKKLFRRAVKRNLLKRRIRESYRRLKCLLSVNGVDMMFLYTGSEQASFESISRCMRKILETVNERCSAQS